MSKKVAANILTPDEKGKLKELTDYAVVDIPDELNRRRQRETDAFEEK